MDIQFSPEARAELEEFLVERFGITPPVEYRPVLDGKASRGTHFLTTDTDGIRIGLKYVSAHFSDPLTKKDLLPTENIVAAADLSKVLLTPSIIDASMAGPIEGLGSLSGLRFAARRWHGEPLSLLQKERIRDLGPRLQVQCGEWVAFGLLFALADGKLQHWTWDEATETIGRCDLELLFFEQGELSDYQALMNVVGVVDALRKGEGEAFDRGVRGMVERLHDRRGEIDVVLANVDDHTAGFLAKHSWARLNPDGFIGAIKSQLSILPLARPRAS